METIAKTSYILSFAADATPVTTVDSGSDIVVETYDCFKNVLQTPLKGVYAKYDELNPATGPIAVAGAEPGDTIKVTVKKFELDPVGTFYVTPTDFLKNCATEPEVKRINVQDGRVHLDEKRSFPVKPMIGVIGVSPAEGAVSTVRPGTHGGNLDCKEITEGASVYLPVGVAGGNLALGDFHALMGDGELAACGVEIGGRVQLHVELIKGVSVQTPVVEDEQAFYVLSSAKGLDEACEHAVVASVAFLQPRMPDVPANDIVMMVGLLADMRVSQMVNPLRTAKVVLPKTAFPVTF